MFVHGPASTVRIWKAFVRDRAFDADGRESSQIPRDWRYRFGEGTRASVHRSKSVTLRDGRRKCLPQWNEHESEGLPNPDASISRMSRFRGWNWCSFVSIRGYQGFLRAPDRGFANRSGSVRSTRVDRLPFRPLHPSRPLRVGFAIAALHLRLRRFTNNIGRRPEGTSVELWN